MQNVRKILLQAKKIRYNTLIYTGSAINIYYVNDWKINIHVSAGSVTLKGLTIQLSKKESIKNIANKTRINGLFWTRPRRSSDEVSLSRNENSCHWLATIRPIYSNEHNEDWNKHTHCFKLTALYLLLWWLNDLAFMKKVFPHFFLSLHTVCKRIYNGRLLGFILVVLGRPYNSWHDISMSGTKNC